MGRITLTPENKVEAYESFPRLKLEFKEKARIAALEDPIVGHVHTFRAPKVVNGKAVMVTKQRKDKSEYETYDMDFVSRPMCLGQESILEEDGIDPKNCPGCAASKTLGSVGSVDAPQRRYAFHVFRYALKGNSSEVAKPFSGQVVVWSFTDKMFNRLVDLVTTWGPLSEHDLEIECKSKEFQQFDISIQPNAVWSLNPKDRETTESYMQENKAKDLEGMLGRKMSRTAMENDIDSIEARWALINGNGTDESSSHLTADLNDILNTTPVPSSSPVSNPSQPPTSTPSPTGAMDFDDLLNIAKSK